MSRLVSVDAPDAPPEQRGLFAVIDDYSGGTLAVGFIEPIDDGVGMEPGSTVGLRFRVQGGIRE